MNYGLPYRGSKNKIAKDIINRLPAGEVFVDLFCGGCAVTHAAMLSGKYKRYIINDSIAMMPNAFRDAVNGKFKGEKRLISKEDFHRLKDSDAYVRTCWSFGNNGRSYLWGEENAHVKMLACKMIMADDWRERRRAYMAFIKYLQDARKRLAERKANMERYRAEYGDIKGRVREELCRCLRESGKTRSDIDRILGTNGMAGHYFSNSQWEFPTKEKYEKIRDACPNFPPYDYWGQSLQSLERLESLQSLESLERLESLQSLEVFTGDYQSVPIPENAVVYCDPPYINTGGYGIDFDHERFYSWLRTRDFPVYVSEYAMPDDFVCIWRKEKICTYSSTNNKKTVEKLFVHEKFKEAVKDELL
nr:MAG TPA: DNA adenine methylase [Caudoviricetes sp.]